ncbi:MAG: histidine phosphatase family protein [Propionibacteriales bacterium]|nr:histidine phosphatase family protein [Propionibacteriales bacterium]
MGAVGLLLVRHGESLGNVAAAAAEAAQADVIEVAMRDADVPLSPAGLEQARAWGTSLAALPREARFDSAWCSPYRRAHETATVAFQQASISLPIRVDERLRDRELGVLDLLSTQGVQQRFPDEAARRKWLGKFYHRPAGGESWADLALRVRSLLADIDRWDDGRRVLLVCHDAVTMIIRYVCEGLSEQDLLAVAKTNPVRNLSVTRLVRPSGVGWWTLESYNDVSHLERHDAPVTHHAGDPHVRPQ